MIKKFCCLRYGVNSSHKIKSELQKKRTFKPRYDVHCEQSWMKMKTYQGLRYLYPIAATDLGLNLVFNSKEAGPIVFQNSSDERPVFGYSEAATKEHC